MKIAIDARWIYPELSGIGVYTQELIREFVSSDTAHEFVLIFSDEKTRDRVAEVTSYPADDRFSDELVEYEIFSFKNQLKLPSLLKSLGVNVFHSPNYMIPLKVPKKIKVVSTIHDLIPMVLRDHAPKSKKSRLYPIFRQLMLEVGRRADAIIAVSAASKKDVLSQLKISNRDKVSVVYNGVNPAFVPVEKTGAEKTILYVGRLDPYKRVIDLVKAYEKLPEGLAKLRLIACKDERYPEVEEYIKEKGLTVQQDQGLAFAELVTAYQQASVFVLPSLYEGFGLPVAEAMAAGTPVICSNSSSLPEVVGTAALMFEAKDVNALAGHLENVLNEEFIAEDLRTRGLAQAEQFSWKKAAEETLAVYSRV